MPVELRKRKAPVAAPAPPPPAKKKAAATAKKPAAKAAVEKVVEKVKEAKEAVKPKGRPAKAAAAAAPAVNGGSDKAAAATAAKGDTITLEGFGGEVETHDGKKTTLKALVDASKAGVVLFTYPKASTPGCTTQACLFRDSYAPLTAGGLAVYGLSADAPKDNAKFKEKQKLPYPLLCDPKATLLAAIGLKKAAGKAARGVFVVDKAGKVLAAEPGSPAGTLEVVKKIVAATAAAEPAAAVEPAKEGEKAAAADGAAAAPAAAEDKKEEA